MHSCHLNHITVVKICIYHASFYIDFCNKKQHKKGCGIWLNSSFSKLNDHKITEVLPTIKTTFLTKISHL